MSSVSPLKIISLSKSYGNKVAVNNINLEIKPGEIFGLLGPNGAGKTSLLSCVTTLETPTTGRIEVFGADTQTHPNITKKQVGIVHQEIINSGFFSIQEIVQFQRGYYGLAPSPGRVQEVLSSLSLWEHREKKVKQLSGGMKRRLMIAKALITEPKLLLLDEPTAGVDISLRENLFTLVRQLKKQGMTILLTTHYLEEAELLCDRVGIIHQGSLEYLGSTQDVIQKFSQKRLTLKLNRNLETSLFSMKKLGDFHYGFDIPMDRPLGQVLNELQVNTADLIDLEIQNGKLEEAFLRVLRKNS